MPVEFILERDNANDENAKVVEILIASGVRVTAGTHVLDIETSKAVLDVLAPADGVLQHNLAVGDTVEFGTVLFTVGSGNAAKALAASRAPASAPPSAVEGGEPFRVSPRARAFAAAAGIDPATVGGRFVTVEHIKQHLLGHVPAAQPARAPVARDPDAAALSPRKRGEILALARGAGNTMLSVIGAQVGAVSRDKGGNPFFAGRIVDLVVFEASRLMRAHPRLNATYVDGDRVRRHDVINAGVAFDDGEHGLMVFGIRNSDRLELPEIQDEFLRGLDEYVSGELTSDDLSSPTFTVTDLSGLKVDTVLPLLPQGQTAIIGITGDDRGGFRLYIGFDHRVTEGRDAARFLEELVARIRSFARGGADLSCHFCGKEVTEETGFYRGRGLLKLVTARGEEVLCCATCFNGW